MFEKILLVSALLILLIVFIGGILYDD